MQHRGGARCAGALALLCALVGLPTAAVSAAPEPVRILVLGDSVAQGSAGDWTWRYRLHQMLDASGAVVDFVGPRDDVFENSDAYADPAFDDREHAARWGMKLAFPDDSIESLMERYEPDVVIETRGINDFAWLESSPEQVEDLVADEVAAAREVDDTVDFVVARLPQRWVGGVEAYNQALPKLAAELSQDDSTVVAADTGHGFQEYVDTWDPAHLAATGEVKMAAGVANALAELGVGTGAGALPVVRNGHWANATLAVEAGDGKAELSWVAPPGAPEQYVWSRDLTACADWARLPYTLVGTSWDFPVTPGHRYDFRLQAAKGSAINDDFSNVVDVVVSGPADPWARQACAPTKVKATPGPDRLTVDWVAVPTASSYDVTWTSDVPGDTGTRTVSGGPVALNGLVGGREYRVSVTARNDAGTGAAAVVTGTPLTALPGRPGRVVVKPGSHRLNLTWAPVPGATAYDVTWVGQRLGLRGSAVVTSPAAAIAHVLAGEPYDVTVTARNVGGSGPVATTVGVPRGPKVPAPAGLRAEQIGARRAQLTWRSRSAASSYSVEVRRHGRWAPVRTVVALSTVVGGLPRGVATFRVRSWHQFVPGAWSKVVRVRMQ